MLRTMTSATRRADCSIKSSAWRRSVFRLRKPNKPKKAVAPAITETASLAARPKRNLERPAIRRCGPCGSDADWVRLRFFRQDGSADRRLLLEDGEVLRDAAENRKSRGHDGKRYRHFAPLRNVVGAGAGFQPGCADVETVGDESEDHHHGARIERAGAPADTRLV